MKTLIDKLLGRIEPVEDRCAWKDVSEVEVVAEWKLKECRACDGYKINCDCYYTK